MILLIKKVCENLFRDGIRNIVLVKGHDMTLGALMVTARELADDTADKLKVVANWLPGVVKRLPEIFDKIPEGKTRRAWRSRKASHMLWQHPELCVPEAMKDYNVDAAVSPTPFISPIVSGGGVYFPRKVTNTDPNFEGTFGSPTVGTPEAGDLMYDEISRWDPRNVATGPAHFAADIPSLTLEVHGVCSWTSPSVKAARVNSGSVESRQGEAGSLQKSWRFPCVILSDMAAMTRT
jgi:hypothetical protein